MVKQTNESTDGETGGQTGRQGGQVDGWTHVSGFVDILTSQIQSENDYQIQLDSYSHQWLYVIDIDENQTDRQLDRWNSSHLDGQTT